MTLSADPSPAKRRMSPRRARRLTATFTTLAVLLVGAYLAACALAPLPAPTVELAGEAEQTLQADEAPARAAVDAQPLPTAAGWLHDDEIWTNSEQPVPIASISKLVTVLVGLEQQPLAAGEDGPVHVWTEEDRERQEEYLAQDGVAYPIPVGTEVTTRQMLTLALVPSANDFAAAYAYSIFGDNDGFVAAVDDWKTRNGIESLVLSEPTGMDERNAATASDVLRIARLALQQPAIAEVVRQHEARLPWGIGTVESTNPLFGRLHGVLGVKTGRTSIAGYNLVAAQAGAAPPRELVKLVVVLGRPTAAERIDSSTAVLAALDAGPQTVAIVTADEVVGTATTVDGVEIPLVASSAVSSTLVPGEAITRVTQLRRLEVGEAGQRAGTIRVESPTGTEKVRVTATAAVVEPGFWWRVTHPGALFG